MKTKLAYWINERDAIRVLKEGNVAKPWSDDPVFQVTYFCNVHREDDKVTRWIADQIRPMFPHPNYEIAIIESRFLNKISTLASLGFPFGWDKDKRLQDFRLLPSPKWGNAYVITTHGQKMNKDDYVFEALDYMSDKLYESRRLETCSAVFNYLKQFDGIGSFLGAQIVADFKNTPEHPLTISPDRDKFVAHGPGSLRGLSWYHDQKVTETSFLDAIQIAYNEVMPLVDESIKPIDMQDFQNALCEFDKYCRVKNGTGRSKRKYAGI